MEDRPLAIDLDASQYMGVVPNDQIGARIDGGLRQRTLVRGERHRRMHNALVQGDDAELSAPLARSTNVLGHLADGARIGPQQWCGRSDRTTVGAVNPYISTARRVVAAPNFPRGPTQL